MLEKNLTTKLIALSSSILEEIKKFIKKEEGWIVVLPPEEVTTDVKIKTVIISCK